VSLRLGFFGTGEFAVPSLQAVHAAGHTLALLACQPDRPRGRGHHLQAPPLKLAAQALGLAVWQPESMRDAGSVQTFSELGLDCACVVSYGQILPQAVLDAPRLGCVNVHASLLPRWRGAAPIERAVAAGDAETGVCVQRMVYRLDAGEVLLERRRPLADGADAPTLHAELAHAGAELLVQALQGLELGTLQGKPQDEARVTLAPMLAKADGVLDFSLGRRELVNRFRAFRARPGLSAELEGAGTLKVLGLADAGPEGGAAGCIVEVAARGLRVACGDGSVWVEKVLPPGGKAMTAVDYARGRAVQAGGRFRAPGEATQR